MRIPPYYVGRQPYSLVLGFVLEIRWSCVSSASINQIIYVVIGCPVSARPPLGVMSVGFAPLGVPEYKLYYKSLTYTIINVGMLQTNICTTTLNSLTKEKC